MSAGSITRLGMVGCDVRDQTVRAVMDIPGVSATFLKAGACGIWRSGIRPQDVVTGRANLLRVRKSFSRIANVGNKGYIWHPGLPPASGFYRAVAIGHIAVDLDLRESEVQLRLVGCGDAAHKWLAERETRMLRL